MNFTLWRDDVELRRAVRAAAQVHAVRSRLYLRVEHDGVRGFGEVSPQPEGLNGDPGIDEVIAELRDVVLAQVRAASDLEDAVPSWTRVVRFAGPRRESNVAVALVEMALLDLELRAAGMDLASLWPARFDTPCLSTVSLLDDEPWEVASAARVRVKTAPHSISTEALERLGALTVAIVLDFNCSAHDDDEVLDQVEAVGAVATIAAVEQPFAAGNVIDHARLGAQLDVALSLDEGVRSVRDLEQIARYRAASLVCIKPARVGGLANARSMVERSLALGLTPYLGGFFESGFARGVHRRLAEHCVSEPSDVGPVATLSAQDDVDVAEGGLGLGPSAAVLARATAITARPGDPF
ncbi:MAG: enolase C-terminal domain-like protein [Acidimicrobiales bacterium]|jgi:O-succinylbenzoate synthase